MTACFVVVEECGENDGIAPRGASERAAKWGSGLCGKGYLLRIPKLYTVNILIFYIRFIDSLRIIRYILVRSFVQIFGIVYHRRIRRELKTFYHAASVRGKGYPAALGMPPPVGGVIHGHSLFYISSFFE